MKFLVTYQMPHQGLDEWLQLPQEERRQQEKDMQDAWNAWMEGHREIISETAGVGKPKRVTSEGVIDARNDIMMYSFIEASSLEEASELFINHPHFGIPGAWIEVMAINKDIG